MQMIDKYGILRVPKVRGSPQLFENREQKRIEMAGFGCERRGCHGQGSTGKSAVHLAWIGEIPEMKKQTESL